MYNITIQNWTFLFRKNADFHQIRLIFEPYGKDFGIKIISIKRPLTFTNTFYHKNKQFLIYFYYNIQNRNVGGHFEFWARCQGMIDIDF